MDEEQNGQSFKTLIVILLIFLSGMTATASFAGLPGPEAVSKAFKKAEKTCKQMEQDHANMKGEHELMFKAWKEKSAPLLSEDEGVIEECKSALANLKEISDEIIKATSDDPLRDTIVNNYEKIQSIIKDISARHRKLTENHERQFHEMMGH